MRDQAVMESQNTCGTGIVALTCSFFCFQLSSNGLTLYKAKAPRYDSTDVRPISPHSMLVTVYYGGQGGL